MRFGLRYVNTGRYADPKQAIALLQAAEEAGFDSAWTVEHIVVPEGYQSAYPYSSTGPPTGRHSPASSSASRRRTCAPSRRKARCPS